MASRVPEFSEIIQSSLAPVAPTVAITPRPDLSLSQQTPAHCIARDSQETLRLSVADYFGFLQSHWEELAQYEPLSDFLATAATIVSQHIYQFLMGLKSEYESLRIQILNTSRLPALYEAFAIIDGDEHRCLIQASPSISPGPTPIADQMAFAASGLGSRSSGGRPIYSYRGDTGHIREQCFKLHPELRGKTCKRKWKGPPRTTTVVDTSPGSTVTLATSTPTVFDAKTSHPTWILDSGANDHITGTPSFPSPDETTILANLDGLPRPIPLFDSPPIQVPPVSAARAPLKVNTRRVSHSASLPLFFGIWYFSFTFSSYFCHTPLSFSYSSSPDHFGFSGCTNYPIAKYIYVLSVSFCLVSVLY
ncbi:hypothetical protein Acr_11g0010880 [Actinidia rufa]|uniref:Uncharacterized protein n=1 Tax=Actinidia rufa TaxID=165716 RepID=A0A7J0FDK5_9ERIC|nr:hypothetical protein Acr_11g0010880 [Actinidia rufa]